jgi:hypothetical protein
MSTFCKWPVCVVRIAPSGCYPVVPLGNTRHPQTENKGLIGFVSQLALVPRCRARRLPHNGAGTESTIPVLA